MNHRFLALALAGTLTLGMLTACGGNANSTESPDAGTTPPVGETTPAVPESSAPAADESQTPSSKPSDAPASKPSATPDSKPSNQPTPTPESKPQTNAVQSMWNEISKLNLPNLTAMDDATLSAMYGISASDLEEYICMMPLMGVHSTEFFIAKVKDGKMDTVKAGIAKRQADLDAQWAQYLPEQYELVKNYKLVTNGNYVLFAVSEHADQAVSIFNSNTK